MDASCSRFSCVMCPPGIVKNAMNRIFQRCKHRYAIIRQSFIVGMCHSVSYNAAHQVDNFLAGIVTQNVRAAIEPEVTKARFHMSLCSSILCLIFLNAGAAPLPCHVPRLHNRCRANHNRLDEWSLFCAFFLFRTGISASPVSCHPR